MSRSLPETKQRRCIFCGPTKEKISGEHLWPLWVSDLFHKRPKPNQYSVVRARANVGDTKWDRGTFRSSRLDQRVNDVCERCNNGWMSDLENRYAKPVLTPMILGSAKPLTAEDLAVINAWAMKFAFACEFISRERFYEQMERSRFMDTLLPPDASHIWLARFVGDARAVAEVHTLKYHLQSPLGTCRAEVTTFAVGQLALQILTGRWPKSSAPTAAAEWERATVLTWPTPAPAVRWPPPLYLSDRELKAFCYRWSRSTPAFRWGR
jgi:hypothetical protein